MIHPSILCAGRLAVGWRDRFPAAYVEAETPVQFASPQPRAHKQKGRAYCPSLKVRAGQSGRRLSIYSSTKIFFFEQISFRIFGHTVTLTSPKCALRSRSISVRDCPIPPPIDSGSSLFIIAL